MSYKHVTVDGLKIFYREAGDPNAQTLLLIHGFATSSHMFRTLIPELEGRYHIIAPDLPGFGFSDSPPAIEFTYSFDALGRILTGFVDTIGLEKFALYVFDYGAPAGFRLALARPDHITALISQNGNAYVEGLSDAWNPIQAYWREPSEKNRDALRGFLTLETTRFQYYQGVANPELRIAPEAIALDQALLDRPGNADIQLDLFKDYQTNIALYPAFQRYFREKQPPFLAVWGKNDPFFLPAGAEAYKRDLPKAEVHFVDSGHFPLETHVSEIALIIRRFLSRVLPSRSSQVFQASTTATASPEAKGALQETETLFGFTPNLAVKMSAEPAALKGYLAQLKAFSETGLSPIEQQIVLLTASKANEADYGVAVHAALLLQAGAAASTVVAAVEDRTLPEPRLDALRLYTKAFTAKRGQVSEADIERMISTGYGAAALVAVAWGVSSKTFANGVAHLTQPIIDAPLAEAVASLPASARHA